MLAGDVFYDKPFADRAGALVFGAARSAARTSSSAIPAAPICPKDRLERLATYEVPVTRALEDAEVKRTTVWRFV